MIAKLSTFTALFILLTIPIQLSAQKSNTTKGSKQAESTETKAIEKTEAQLLIEDYRFEEAMELLQKDINTAKRRKKPTTLMESDLQLAQMGANMLRGTEKVVIVDSMVVPLKSFLDNFKLSEGCGTIAPLSKLVPQLASNGSGQSAYLNDFDDRITYAAPDTSGLLKLFSADKLGSQWGEPHQLQGMGEADDIQDFPYMMADGVTLYYAAQSSESLGGYDIYVTRYNNATGEYVKAENVGMPFNSPANDYLMVIDEGANIGWFVSDRNQPADKVCIYRFIPNDSREVYDLSEENADQVRRLAKIASLAESHTDASAVSAAKARIAQVMSAQQTKETAKIRFVINDNKVYTSLNQFKNATARKLAQHVLENEAELEASEAQLDALRREYAKQRRQSTAGQILQLEKTNAELYQTINTQLKAMRRAELGE